METYLYLRPDMDHSGEALGRLCELLSHHLPGARVNAAMARKIETATGVAMAGYEKMEPGGIAISYGGDGTLLDCVRLASGAGVPVLGINSGRLGFLANVPVDDMEGAFRELAAGNFTVEERPLLDVQGDLCRTLDFPYAFNEFSVQRGAAGMIAVEARVDGELVATYWGDGAMLSTPAGSTAYSLSVGGPVVAPACECLILSPIAPHNLSMRPVVIPDRSTVTLRVSARSGEPYATLDNQTCTIGDGALFTIKKAKKEAKLVRLQNISFYDTLRNKMLWGIDRRAL